tara:strand:+ start:4852 stop:5523 length:672 start_codon:yes stop_codon:yes gene_type:complete
MGAMGSRRAAKARNREKIRSYNNKMTLRTAQNRTDKVNIKQQIEASKGSAFDAAASEQLVTNEVLKKIRFKQQASLIKASQAATPISSGVSARRVLNQPIQQLGFENRMLAAEFASRITQQEAKNQTTFNKLYSSNLSSWQGGAPLIFDQTPAMDPVPSVFSALLTGASAFPLGAVPGQDAVDALRDSKSQTNWSNTFTASDIKQGNVAASPTFTASTFVGQK